MKFSIITCAYNSLEGLKATIHTLREQAGGGKQGAGGIEQDSDTQISQFSNSPIPFHVEHVIIDGGSTDGTVEALRTWETGDGRREAGYELKWISEPDQGLYDALNKGLKIATGDVIGILHTDDVWEPGTLQRVAGCMEHGAGSGGGSADDTMPHLSRPSVAKADAPCPMPPDGIYGDLLYVDADDITKVKRVWRSGSYNQKKWWNGWMPPHPALFVTRDLAERVGEYRLDLGSAADYEWMLRAGLVHNAKLVHLPEILVRMRVGGQSNASVQGRLKAHHADRTAWEVNGLTPKPWTLKMKVIRKVPQWMFAVVRQPARGAPVRKFGN